jgi:hypothetical protein
LRTPIKYFHVSFLSLRDTKKSRLFNFAERFLFFGRRNILKTTPNLPEILTFSLETQSNNISIGSVSFHSKRQTTVTNHTFISKLRSASMHVFTESQKSLFTCVPKGAALLSLVSASYAGVKILRSQRRLRRMYHRIFLGLTASCMVSNITFIVGTWAMPAEAQGLFVMNIGNEWTCAAQAFFSELGVAGSYSYLSALSISSCLAIRHDFQEIRYRKYEKYIHFTCILLPLILSILLLASGNYGTDGK